MFAGTHTALITPFKGGRTDKEVLRQLVERQIAAGVAGVVPVGTTGESPTLTREEHLEVIALTIEYTGNQSLVIAGTGSNSTHEAVALTQEAEKAGADAALLVCPYYNKPSPEGLFQHFKAVAESTALPLILYSIPGRCGIEIDVKTVIRLQQACSNIRGLKEAGGSVERVNHLRSELPDTFTILSGDDSLTLPFMSVGAQGVVSVASNLIPEVMVELVVGALNADWEKARLLHHRYYPLFRAFLKLDTNPVPIKTAMHLAGLADPELRLPLVGMKPEKADELRAVLKQLKII